MVSVRRSGSGRSDAKVCCDFLICEPGRSQEVCCAKMSQVNADRTMRTVRRSVVLTSKTDSDVVLKVEWECDGTGILYTLQIISQVT